MQIPADPLDAAALDAALQPGQERRFRHLLEADWDDDGTWDHALSDLSAAATSVVVTQELADSTPGSQATSSGTSAGGLTALLGGHLVVGGQQVRVAELFAPYNDQSPLYGYRVVETPIRWTVLTSTTRGWIPVTQFVGWLDERDVQQRANTVTLTAINIPPKLRDPVVWIPWAVDGPAAGRVNGHAPQRGLASSVVDYIVNAAGLRTRPRPPWQSAPGSAIALLWLPLCGSLAPSAGRMLSQHPWGNFQYFPETYPISPDPDPAGEYWVDGGPFGLARGAKPGLYPGSLLFTTEDSQPVWTGRSTSISAWIYCGPTAPGYDAAPAGVLRHACAQVYFGYSTASGSYRAFRLTLASSGPTVQVWVENGTATLRYGTHTPATDGWRHCHAQLDHNTGSVVTGTLIVDGVTQVSFTGSTGSTTTAPTLNALFLPQVGARVSPGARCCDIAAWQETGTPAVVPERTVIGTPSGGLTAEVDRSLNEITHLPPGQGGSGWDVIKDIAAAEYAAVHIHEDGTFHFHNRDNVRWSATQTPLTLSMTTEVGTVESQAGAANTALVSAQPGEATWQKAWETASVDQIVAPAGVTEWVFPLADDVIAIESGTVPRVYQSAASASVLPVWSASVDHGYVFVYDNTETESTDQNMVLLTDQSGLEPGNLRIVVTNTSTTTGRFRLKTDTTSGTDPQPALRIGGLVLVRPPAETSTVTFAENVVAHGEEHTINLTGGDWRQHLPSVEASARFALRTATQYIPTWDRFTGPGDPRRQLSDPYVLELGAPGPRVLGFCTGITRTFDGDGLTDTLTIRATHAPGRWALGDPVLGVLGDTAVLG